MLIVTDLEFAKHLARRAHAGQRERFGGAPYVEHLARVVDAVNGDDARTVAWLHDIVEDTPLTLEALRALFPASIVRVVGMLTRRPEFESYDQYITSIARGQHPVATAVKIADLRDHLRADGPPIPVGMRTRYVNALHVLESLPHDAYVTAIALAIREGTDRR